LRGEMPKWMPRVNELLQLIGGAVVTVDGGAAVVDAGTLAFSPNA
jgi:hypothetical protein